MKEKLIKILNDHIGNYDDDVAQNNKISEEIIKEINKSCCEKCKYLTESWSDSCAYHHFNISDPEILKCNDFYRNKIKTINREER